MKKIAELANVSRPAVSIVLSGSQSTRVSAKTRKKILRLAEKYDFVPSLAARQLKGVSSNLIGLIFGTHIGIWSETQMKVIAILQSRGFEVLTAYLTSNKDQRKIINEFRTRRINGIIGFALDTKIIQSVDDHIPMVYCSHNNLCGFDVGSDIGLGGYLAARHLLEHGRRKLVYAGWGIRSDRLKYEGVCKAFEEAGMKAGKDNFLVIENGNSKEILSQLRKRRADALICCNDHTAAEIIKVFQQNGIKVPDDLAVTGFDGFSLCKYTHVSLATVVQPVGELAQRTVELLLDRMDARQSHEEFSNIKLPPFFQPGGSCGCPEPRKDTVSGYPFILLDDTVQSLALESQIFCLGSAIMISK